MAQKEDYHKKLDKYKDRVVGSIMILKNDDKEMLSKVSQEDTLTTKLLRFKILLEFFAFQ